MSDLSGAPILPPRGRVCVRCVMDESDPDLRFEPDGRCNFCVAFDVARAKGDFDLAARRPDLDAAVASMRAEGRGHRYDCVMGLSGGADSSYAALVSVRDLGLRPLIVHVDNGWNSELAVRNIELVVRGLGLDLFTHVIDWEEFRDLQFAHLRASVVDLELPSDHAILAGMYHTARRFRVRWIATGDNNATEVTLPRTWNHRKTDLRNLRAIHSAFGSGRLSTFPQLSTVGLWAHQRLLRVRTIGLLSYVPYDKAQAMKRLSAELGWRPYPQKHYESIITRFYQGYMLPKKFGIDKRRIHLSRLVCTGQMTRDAALEELSRSPYDPQQLSSDKEFVAKKFGITASELDRILDERPVPHLTYPSDERIVRGLIGVARRVRGARHSLSGRSATSAPPR